MPHPLLTPPDNASPAVRLTRGLEQRYRYVLICVALLLVLDQVVLQPLLVQLNGLAPAINLAGRQRMLSQRITKTALALNRPQSIPARESYRREMNQALVNWRQVHIGLQEGDHELQLNPPANTEIAAALAGLDAPFQAMELSAERIAASEAVDSSDLEVVLATESEYLGRMDEIVALYESEAQSQVQRLRLLAAGGFALVLVLLAGLGRVVVRPAIHLIQSQVEELIEQKASLKAARDHLEERVRERTKELTAAKEALEQEIHQRELIEERNRGLQQQLAHASRVTSLGQLATGLAHEINQPLAAIANYAETADIALSQNGGAAGATDCVARIRSAALRAGQIVRRMRNFVRRAEAEYANVSLRDLIDEVLQLCRFELQRGGVQLELELDDVNDTVCADAIQIQQVLVNLVRNSLQAMEQAAIPQPRLAVRLTHIAGELQVEVQDNGPGFEAAASASLRSPFVTTKSDGLGLGLAISRSIIAAHRGRLWAANVESGGACVSFSLPLAASHSDHVELPADSVCRG